MAAEQVADMLSQLQGLGLDASIASTAIATMFARLEQNMRSEFESKQGNSNGKRWNTRVAKDENTFKYSDKGSADSDTGFNAWRWHFDLAIEQHCPEAHTL